MVTTFQQLIAAAPRRTRQRNDRPVFAVPPIALESFKRLVGANAVAEVAEARKEVEEEIVNEVMLDAYAEAIWDHGVPPNPKLQTDLNGRIDMSGIFQVQHRFKINLQEAEGEETLEDRFVKSLMIAGLNRQQSQNIFDTEIDASPFVALRPFSELVNGHYEGKVFIPATIAEQAVGSKLMRFCMGETDVEPLTETERTLVLRYEERIKVRDGFIQRLKGYCLDANEIKSVLRIIVPVHFVSHLKYGISGTPEENQIRLREIAADLIGMAA